MGEGGRAGRGSPSAEACGPLAASGGATETVFAVGDTIGQCRLDQMVGSGAFGVVFKARHQLLDIPVAVKFLPVELAAKNPEFVDLFLLPPVFAKVVGTEREVGEWKGPVQKRRGGRDDEKVPDITFRWRPKPNGAHGQPASDPMHQTTR